MPVEYLDRFRSVMFVHQGINYPLKQKISPEFLPCRFHRVSSGAVLLAWPSIGDKLPLSGIAQRPLKIFDKSRSIKMRLVNDSRKLLGIDPTRSPL